MMPEAVSIAGRAIGPGQPPYVIAEISANHNGDIKRALKLIELAKASGADAVKLQTYTADTMTLDCDDEPFVIKGGLWDGRKLYDLYREAATPWEWHEALFAKGREVDITVFSTPFDETAVDFLESLGAPAYKLASFEAVDLPLIRRVAATGKPLIISTGMANVVEIGEAAEAARAAGSTQMVLLHCVSAYPAPVADSNLRTMQDLASRFQIVAGLSDHTLGTAVSISAVALGAAVIEKHFTLGRKDGGPDAPFSIEPNELRDLCKGCRDAWEALGCVSYERGEAESHNVVFRRSLYVVQDIRVGELLTEANIRSIRPGFGLPVKEISHVIGRRAAQDIRRGTPLSWEMVVE